MRDGRLTLDARVLCLTLDGPGIGRLEWKKQTNQNTDHDWIFRHESSVISHHATIVYKGGLVIMYPIIVYTIRIRSIERIHMFYGHVICAIERLCTSTEYLLRHFDTSTPRQLAPNRLRLSQETPPILWWLPDCPSARAPERPSYSTVTYV